MCSAISSDAVAAGDGALSTCTCRAVRWMRKSSASAPLRRSACARTPDGAGTRSSGSIPGTSSARLRANTRRDSDRTSSPIPGPTLCAPRRHRPGQDSESARSRTDTSAQR